MDESLLRTIAQLQEFLKATPDVGFSAHGVDSDNDRYGHISRVLERFDYPRRSKAERGAVRAYLVRTSGYSRVQLTRLVTLRLGPSGRCTPGQALPCPGGALCAQVQRQRHRAAGGDGPGQRIRVRPGDRAPVAARLAGLWLCALRTAGRAVRLAPVKPAQENGLSATAQALNQDAFNGQSDRLALGTAPQ
jgi:hypothetical protein